MVGRLNGWGVWGKGEGIREVRGKMVFMNWRR